MLGEKALAGVKVVDLTTALSGPFGTMFFADYGAEVIKVEPVNGDQSRKWGPFEEKSKEGAYYVLVNRNKKGVTLNLKSEKGLEMFYDLIKDADIIWENYRGGVTKNLKIDYETVKKFNPDVIYVSGSGFGQTGPLSQRPCYDIIAQSMGGFLGITGFPDSFPVKAGPSLADTVSGMYQVIGALIALFHKQRTGQGQLVDVSMMDSMFSLLDSAVLAYTMSGKIADRIGNLSPSVAPFDLYKCKDGYVTIAIANDSFWPKLCNAVGREDLIEDPEFKTNDLRFKNYNLKLKKILQDWTIQYTKKEIDDIMEKFGIPSGSVLNIKEVVEHQQIKARDMLVHCKHPTAGDLYFQGVVAKLSKTPGSVDFPSPTLGQHNKEIFGLSDEEMRELQNNGII